MEGDALDQDQQHEHGDPCKKTVIVSVEEYLASLAHAFTYPLAMMGEALTAEVAFGTVEDGIVDDCLACGTSTVSLQVSALRMGDDLVLLLKGKLFFGEGVTVAGISYE